MMKKIFIALFMTAVTSALCFAQEAASTVKTTPAAPAAPAVVKPAEKKIVSGKVESVTFADPAKGTKSEIAVVDESGKKNDFLVKSTTTIYDADWKATTLDKVNKDQKVRIKYTTTKEGVNEALSISAVK